MNPARSLAAALGAWQLGSLWIYLTAPVAGAWLGVVGCPLRSRSGMLQLTVDQNTQKMKGMNVWRLIPHHIDRQRAISWTRRNNRISIGWNRVGDIGKYQSQADVKRAIQQLYPRPQFSNNSHLGAPSLWDLRHSMNKDDLIILSGIGGRRVLVVQVQGDYKMAGNPSPSEGRYQHQRPVRLTQIDADELWEIAGGLPGSNIYQTLIRCANTVGEEQLSQGVL